MRKRVGKGQSVCVCGGWGGGWGGGGGQIERRQTRGKSKQSAKD